MCECETLGPAAGVGLQGWNCKCPPCRGARDGSPPGRQRTPSATEIGADDARWFLFNASPDISSQMASRSAVWSRMPTA